jgi:CDP-glycerol glycerophosphotransferase
MRGEVRLKRGVQRVRLAAARRAPVRVRVPRLLSVVVVVRDAEAELDECLTSLLRQHYEACEVVVVDLGLPPAAAVVATRHAREDHRVRVVASTGGLAAGRNRGAEVAVGEFLAFVDADDAVTPHGYAMAVGALRRSGSDLAVFAHRRMRRGHAFPVEERVQALHSERLLRTTLVDLPDLLADTVTGSRVFRRTAYDEHGLRFPALRCCDDAHSAAAYIAAGAVDLLPHVGLLRRAEQDRAPLTRRAADTDGLRAFWEGAEAAGALLPPGLAAVFAAEVLSGPLVPFLDRAWRCPDDYWTVLRDVIDRARTAAANEALARVPAYRKVLSGLVAADERERARALLTGVRPTPRRYATTRTRLDDRPVVVMDLGDEWADLPEHDRALAEREVDVRAEVTSLAVADNNSVELRGWAFVDNVDLADRPPRTRLGLRPDGGGVEVALDVTSVPAPEADVAADLHVADVTAAGFSAALDPSRLLGSRVWHLIATVGIDELERSGRVAVKPWTMAGIPAWPDAAGRVLFVDHDDAGRFELHVEPAREVASSVEVRDDRLVLRLPEGVRRVALEPAGSGTPVVADVGATGLAELTLGTLPRATRWTLTGRGRTGPPVPLRWPAVGDVSDPRVRPDRRGVVTVTPYARSGEVVSVELAGEELVTRLALPSAVSGWETALVVGATAAVSGISAPLGGDLVEARYPLSRTAWGHRDLPLPSGQYAVAVRNDEVPDWHPARLAPGLTDSLPLEELGRRMRLRLEAFAPDHPGVRVVVGPPLADDELGARHQRLLRETSRVELADRDAVFFRAMFSEFANGNGLGVHEELVRRGTRLELLWSVVDRSVPVPPGGTGLVERSRAWHEAVARARYHVVDVHQLEWFERPRDQVLIQTFHGYPYKVMGHEWWEKMGNSVQEIGSLDRRTREWSVLVSPAAYATPLLRAAFLEPAGADDVPVLETGYPRNDALLRPEAAQTRARARAVLGLDDHAVAVLYAPTFRDYLSPEDRTARTVSFFEADEALALLPDHYVLLLRGHAFNARIRSDRVRSTGRVLDVTDHPDVNDLVLASDAAVLDYSSLRFDYVLSGHPMVFLVPDLEEYDAARGGVIPYAPTAPGPHVATTREAASWLADLPRLIEEYAEARHRFREDYVELDDGNAAARLVDATFTPRGDG